MQLEDMVVGKEYRVVANTGGHEFRIGEIVRYRGEDEDADSRCDKLDGSDYWYMYPEELEEV